MNTDTVKANWIPTNPLGIKLISKEFGYPKVDWAFSGIIPEVPLY
jgi:hypothetical protein